MKLKRPSRKAVIISMVVIAIISLTGFLGMRYRKFHMIFLMDSRISHQHAIIGESNALIDFGPDDKNSKYLAYMNRALALATLGEHEEAEEDWVYIKKQFGGIAPAHYKLMADVYLRQRQSLPAFRKYVACVKAFPNRMVSYLQYANFLKQFSTKELKKNRLKKPAEVIKNCLDNLDNMLEQKMCKARDPNASLRWELHVRISEACAAEKDYTAAIAALILATECAKADIPDVDVRERVVKKLEIMLSLYQKGIFHIEFDMPK